MEPFLSALSSVTLSDIRHAATAEAHRRAAAIEASRCGHPIKPACGSCGGPLSTPAEVAGLGTFDGVAHKPTCSENISRARRLTYHPSAGVRQWVERVLAAARLAGAP
jgi:hypothetical protein